MKTLAFSAFCTDNDILLSSSSGGLFSLFATSILQKNGIVYGASFDKNWNVYHIPISNIKELKKIRGAKYVQSRLGDTFLSVKTHLKEGRQVLFCGTPCQVYGLKLFLRNTPIDKLLTIDFVCHGVPSSKIWQKYMEGKKDGLSSVNFRNKRFGWKTYSLRFDYKNGKIKSSVFTYNKYMQSFIHNYTLRPSCYNCKVKGIERNCDITLGDFWGIKNVDGQMNNLNGVSLILIHTIKGFLALRSIQEKIIIKSEDITKSIQMNPSIVYNAQIPNKRTQFFSELETLSFNELYNKYVANSLTRLKLLFKGLIKVILFHLKKN